MINKNDLILGLKITFWIMASIAFYGVFLPWIFALHKWVGLTAAIFPSVLVLLQITKLTGCKNE